MNLTLPPEIAAAFRLAPSDPIPISGGQGATFCVGNAALKRCDDIPQTEWLFGVLENLPENRFRIARPIRSTSGNFVVDGWCACQWLDGSTPIENRWIQAIDALIAFHEAIAHVPCDPVLQPRDNPWARADAVVWSDSPRELDSITATARLLPLLRPVTLPSQLIQGDPGEGNLLFAPGLSPAIIDIAPYWHPASHSIAMFLADGIAWSKAPLTLLERVADWPQMDQLLLRAVLFRLYVGYLFRGGEQAAEKRAAAYAPVIDAIHHWPHRPATQLSN